MLQEAFSRPHPGSDSLQRHPTDAGALEAEADPGAIGEDPWRDPAAGVGLGNPAISPRSSSSRATAGQAGPSRGALRRPGVPRRAGDAGLTALLIGVVGGWVGRKTAEVVEAFTTSKVTLSTSDSGEVPARFSKVAASVADSVVTIKPRATRKVPRVLVWWSTDVALSSPTTTSSPKRPPSRAGSR